ncbi:MAG: tetratricopeptide repeat protein, partial [Candidatus Acidiferrales bacterium]
MNLKNLPPVVICIMIFLISSFYTPAQTADWGADLASASSARQNGDYALAARFYRHAIETQEKVLGANSLEVAASLNNLAVMYQDASMDSKAEPLYIQALAIWTNHAGQEVLAAQCLNNLAELHRDENMPAAAEKEYRGAIGMWERTHQAATPRASASIAGLADLYYS